MIHYRRSLQKRGQKSALAQGNPRAPIRVRVHIYLPHRGGLLRLLIDVHEQRLQLRVVAVDENIRVLSYRQFCRFHQNRFGGRFRLGGAVGWFGRGLVWVWGGLGCHVLPEDGDVIHAGVDDGVEGNTCQEETWRESNGSLREHQLELENWNQKSSLIYRLLNISTLRQPLLQKSSNQF